MDPVPRIRVVELFLVLGIGDHLVPGGHDIGLDQAVDGRGPREL